MNSSTIIELIILCLLLIMSMGMICYCLLRGKRTPLLYSFILIQVLLIIWLIGKILWIGSAGNPVAWYFLRFQYLALCFFSLAWLIFCLLYVESKFVYKWFNILLLCAAPTFFFLAVLTNDWHQLFFSAQGHVQIFFYIHLAEIYLYSAIGAFLLIKYSFHQYDYIKKQTLFLICAMLFVLIVNTLCAIRFFQFSLDCRPVCFMISVILVFIATFKYKLLDLLPIDQHQILKNIQEAIAIMDNQNKFVDYNPAFETIFPEVVNTTNSDFNLFLKTMIERADQNSIQSLLRLMKDINIKDTFKIEIKLMNPALQWLNINIQAIKNQKDLLVRVITVNDISAYQNLVEELNQNNTQLMQMNAQTEQYTATIEELAIVKERNRIARDMHDTLGQTMTLLLALLQIAALNCGKDSQETEKRLKEAIRIAEEGLAEVRSSLAGLTTKQLNLGNLLSALQNLFASYQIAGLKGNLTVEGYQESLSLSLHNAIYRLCQEALTNAVRHGKAHSVEIRVTQSEGKVEITVDDDGCGCDKVSKGNGLFGMEERITALNGNISISSQSGEGFHIHAVLPMTRR